MRLALVSDIHGNLPALEAVLAEIEHARVDAIVNLGDILSGPLWPQATSQRLMALGWPTIRGNHERQLLDQPPERMNASDAFAAKDIDETSRAWLASLPATRWLADDVFCCHGTPESDLVYFLETTTAHDAGIRPAHEDEVRARLGDVRASLVLCGHTHVPRVVQCGATLIVNPGSVGVPAYEGDLPHPHRVENGSPHARWAIVDRAAHGWNVELRATSYDHEAVARRAEANGRPEWAHALRTGRMPRATETAR